MSLHGFHSAPASTVGVRAPEDPPLSDSLTIDDFRRLLRVQHVNPASVDVLEDAYAAFEHVANRKDSLKMTLQGSRDLAALRGVDQTSRGRFEALGHQALRTQIANLINKNQARIAEIAQLKNTQLDQQATIEGLQATIETQQAKIDAQQTTIEAQQAKIEAQQATIEAQQAKIDAQQKAIDGLLATIGSQQETIAELGKQVRTLTERLDHHEAK